MRKIYILYVIAALCTAWIVAFYLGFSAGFANYVPIAALLGSVLLFVIAVPLIVYYQRPGLFTGLIGCFLMLPYSLMFVGHLFKGYSGKWKFSIILIMIPSILVLINAYLTVNSLFIRKSEMSPIATHNVSKLILAGIPVLLFVIYLVLYGSSWSWDMFKA